MMFRKYAFFYFVPPNKILNQVHTVHLINGVIINEIIINLLREQSSCRHLMPPVAFKHYHGVYQLASSGEFLKRITHLP